MKQGVKRIYFLDEIRGFAIICMVFHHMFLDIGNVLYKSWGYEVFDFLCYLQPFFWAIFIITSGICSRLSRNTTKRGIIVLGFGLALTFVTVVIAPKIGIDGAQIYFGILSCLGSCMIISGIFQKVNEKINPKIGMLISAILFLFTYGVNSRTLLFGLIKLPDVLYKTNYFMPLGFFNESFYSADYFSLIPWLFLFLFGVFLGAYAAEERFPNFMYKKKSKFLCFVGRNSLWVYIIHQPVLYVIMYIISFIELIKS